jgi:transposase-like protein
MRAAQPALTVLDVGRLPVMLSMGRARNPTSRSSATLREAENRDEPVKDRCKRHNISEQTFYRWRNKLTRRGLSQRKACGYLGLSCRVTTYTLKQPEKDRIYNERRPHSAHRYQPPATVRRAWLDSDNIDARLTA